MDPSQRRRPPAPAAPLRPGVRIAGRNPGGGAAKGRPSSGRVAGAVRGPAKIPVDPGAGLAGDRPGLGGDDRRESGGLGGGQPPVSSTSLRGNEWIYETLLELHRTGMLDALVPEFGRVRCLALHDLYHIYTVDQHLMRAVKEFRASAVGGVRGFAAPPVTARPGGGTAGDPDPGHPVPRYRQGPGRRPFRAGDGRWRWMWRSAWALNEDERELLAFLVLHHLLLTGTAFRRDIQDEKTVLDLADTVGTAEKSQVSLRADVLGCEGGWGRDVWNNWKGALLEELCNRTLNVLEEREKGESARPDRDLKVQRIQDRLMAPARRGASRGGGAAGIHRCHARPLLPHHSRGSHAVPLPAVAATRRRAVFWRRCSIIPSTATARSPSAPMTSPDCFASIAGVFRRHGAERAERAHQYPPGRAHPRRFSESPIRGKAEVVMDSGKWSTHGAGAEAGAGGQGGTSPSWWGGRGRRFCRDRR